MLLNVFKDVAFTDSLCNIAIQMSVVLLRIDFALMMHNDAVVVGQISGFYVRVTGIRLSWCCCEDSTCT